MPDQTTIHERTFEVNPRNIITDQTAHTPTRIQILLTDFGEPVGGSKSGPRYSATVSDMLGSGEGVGIHNVTDTNDLNVATREYWQAENVLASGHYTIRIKEGRRDLILGE
ncbi:MAG: hypothetical protein ABIH92_02420 [Nanoarchaeota archaeon]